MQTSDSARAVSEHRLASRDDLAEAAHELKLPIAVALALCASAAETDDAAQIHRDLSRIAANVRAVREQLEELLDGGRLRRDAASRCEPVDLAALVRSCAAGFTHLAARRGVEVRLETPGELQAVVDRERVAMAMRNLLTNAVRHAQDSGVVRVTLRVSAETGRAEIEVADDGPGVPPALREAVFDRYRHFDRDGRRGGSGIGLAVVRDVATAHGGAVHVGTAAEGGASFTLELPLAPAIDAAA
jgi:signal transduction histidine kinase